MNYNDIILAALRDGKTPEEVAAELTSALSAAEAQIKEEEARAAAAAKTEARNEALKNIIESTLTWFDNYAPDADVRSMIESNIDYNELADMMIELAGSLKQLAVLTHVMPNTAATRPIKKMVTKTNGKKSSAPSESISDEEAINFFLKNLGF